MRILHCIHSLNPAGGGPADFVQTMTSLSAVNGVAAEVACFDAPDSPWFSNYPVPVHAFGPAAGWGYSPKFLPWLKTNRDRFDIVVVNGLWQYVQMAVRLGLRTGKTPFVVFADGMLDPWFNETYPLKHLKKQIYWLLNERFVLADARAVFFTAAPEMARAARSFWPYRLNGMTVPYGTMPPPVDLQQAKERFLAKHPELAQGNTFVYLSRVHPKKGVDLLLKAFALEAGTDATSRLLIVGPTETSYWDSLKINPGLSSNTRYMPAVAGEDKWGLLANASALILPSHQENFARVVSEALSCAVPILLSDKVNIHEDVVSAGAGISAPDTLDGTRQLLKSFLSLTPEQRRNMSERARECHASKFNIEKNFHNYLNVLKSLL